MKLKSNTLSKEETQIIKNGNVGLFKNITELEFYLEYLKKNKSQIIKEIKNQYNKEFRYLPANSLAKLFSIFGITFGGILIYLGNSLISIIFILAAIISIIIPELMELEQAENEYNTQINYVKQKITEKKAKNNLSLSQNKAHSSQENLMSRIKTTLNAVSNIKYPNSKKDIKTIYTLTLKYLKIKKKLKSLEEKEIMKKFPELHKIITRIEEKIDESLALNENREKEEAQKAPNNLSRNRKL